MSFLCAALAGHSLDDEHAPAMRLADGCLLVVDSVEGPGGHWQVTCPGLVVSGLCFPCRPSLRARDWLPRFVRLVTCCVYCVLSA